MFIIHVIIHINYIILFSFKYFINSERRRVFRFILISINNLLQIDELMKISNKKSENISFTTAGLMPFIKLIDLKIKILIFKYL